MHIPATERLKSIPEFLGIRVNEEPCYQVVERLSGLEIRGYDPIRVARCRVAGSFEEFRGKAFERLAEYLFEKNAEGRSMAMTSPVFLERDAEGWGMTFALPAKYVMEPAPRPLDDGVQVGLIPSRMLAVRSFSGTNTEAKMAAAAAWLKTWLDRQVVYRPASPVFWAQYDAPFVLPFVKTNEAMVEIHRAQ